MLRSKSETIPLYRISPDYPRSSLVHTPLQLTGLGQGTEMALAEARFCVQLTILK